MLPAFLLPTFALAMAVLGRFAPDTAGRIAARAFTTPPRRNGTPHAVSPRARRDWIRVDGVRIAVWTWGNAERDPVALLVHGWGGRADQLQSFVGPLLASGRAVIAFDLPAHGESEGQRASLPRFTRAIRSVADRVHRIDSIVAHSLGAAAVTLALHQGLQVGRVVLVSPPADCAREARRFAHAVGLPPEAISRMLAWLDLTEGVEIERLAVRHLAPALATPALVIHDLEDRAVPWGDGEHYALRWPQARLLTTVGLGHRRILDDPKVIAAAIDWIEGAEVGRRIVGSRQLAAAL